MGGTNEACAREEASKACKTRSEVADDPSRYAVKIKVQHMSSDWSDQHKIGNPRYFRYECTDFYGGE